MGKLSQLFDKSKSKKNAHAALDLFKESTPIKEAVQNEPIEYKLSSFLDESKEEWDVQGLDQSYLNDSPLVPTFKIGTVDSTQIATKEEVKAKTWGASEEVSVKPKEVKGISKSKNKRENINDKDLHDSINAQTPKLPNTDTSTPNSQLQTHSENPEQTKLKEIIDSLNKEIIQLKSQINSLALEKAFNVTEFIDLSIYKKKNDIIPNQQEIRQKYETRRKMTISSCI